MKKFLTVMMMITLVAGFAFANQAVNITGSVATDEPKFTLTGDFTGDITVGGSETFTSAASSLTSAGSKSITVHYTAFNLPEAATYTVKAAITQGFRRSGDGEDKMIIKLSKDTISAKLDGYNSAGGDIGTITVSWDGDSTLPAGDYTATVSLTFTAQ